MDWSLVYRVWISPDTYWGFIFLSVIVGSLLGVIHSLLLHFKVEKIPTTFFVKGTTMCVELFLGSALILIILSILR